MGAKKMKFMCLHGTFGSKKVSRCIHAHPSRFDARLTAHAQNYTVQLGPLVLVKRQMMSP